MLHTWSDVEDFLMSSAAQDLSDDRPVVPVVVAFHGERPLFFAGLREFARGEYYNPMIELLALAGALGADRLATAFPARAWSLDDPLPPVIDGVGDLRQRVVVMTFVDAAVTPTRRTSTIAPYELDGAHGRWEPPLREDAGEGWITEALTVCAEQSEVLRDDPVEARLQAQRCVELGHLLVLHPAAAAELDLEPVPRLT